MRYFMDRFHHIGEVRKDTYRQVQVSISLFDIILSILFFIKFLYFIFFPAVGNVPTSMRHSETKSSNDGIHPTTTITNGVPHARPAVQYASLCLGALHYMFGHLVMARESIEESMRVAQHYGDHRCVTFALAWIQRIVSDQHAGMSATSRNLLERAASRAQELGLPHLHALTAFAIVEENMRGVVTSSTTTLATAATTGNVNPLGLLNSATDTHSVASTFLENSLASLITSRGNAPSAADLSSYMLIDDTFVNSSVGMSTLGVKGSIPNSHDIHSLLSKQLKSSHHDVMEARSL